MNAFLQWMGGDDSDRGARRLGIALGFGALALVLIGWTAYSPAQSTALTEIAHEGSSERIVEVPALFAQADGEQIYSSRCSTCHQASGKGVPGVFPPLNGTKWVTEDKGRLVLIILHGLSGSIEVKGQTYSGSMPPWGSFLSNEEVAQVATYIRQNFGNEASEVTADEVETVRSEFSDRKKPWTAEELSEHAGLLESEGDSKGGDSKGGDAEGDDETSEGSESESSDSDKESSDSEG